MANPACTSEISLRIGETLVTSVAAIKETCLTIITAKMA